MPPKKKTKATDESVAQQTQLSEGDVVTANPLGMVVPSITSSEAAEEVQEEENVAAMLANGDGRVCERKFIKKMQMLR